MVEETGATFLHPYNHPDVIAGQGTIGLEFLNHVRVAHRGAGGVAALKRKGCALDADRNAKLPDIDARAHRISSRPTTWHRSTHSSFRLAVAA